MDNIENNKLIADFMVAKAPYWNKDDNQGEGEQLYFQPHDTKYQQMYPKEMLFQHSWDWLMPVVEKIETLFNNGIDVDIFSDGTVITQYRFEENEYLTEGEEIVRLTKAEIGFDTKIEHTYQAVVEFIKWYNKTTKENPTAQQNKDLGQSTII